VPEETRDRQLITIRSEDESGEDVQIYMGLREMTVEEITPIVTEMYEENEDLMVYLRADRYVKHKHVKAVMGACAEAGIADIIFGTFESGN